MGFQSILALFYNPKSFVLVFLGNSKFTLIETCKIEVSLKWDNPQLMGALLFTAMRINHSSAGVELISCICVYYHLQLRYKDIFAALN